MSNVIQFKNDEQLKAEDIDYLREHTPEYLVRDRDIFVPRTSPAIQKMNTSLVREFAGVVRSNPPIGWVKISFVNEKDLIAFIKRI